MKKKRQKSSPIEEISPPETAAKFPTKTIFGVISLLIGGGLAFYFFYFFYFKDSPKRTNKPIGAIFQISQIDGKILSQLDKTDAFGLAVFNSAKGKKLYFGLARMPEIWSIDLTDDGKFTGDSRREISLEHLGTRGDDKARRINFSNNEMIVFGVEFNFNLVAPSEKQEMAYRFRYDAMKDVWNYVAEPPQIVGEVKPPTS